MSRCIDLFVHAPVELEELATNLGQLAGVTFIGDVDGKSWLLREGNSVARLAEHSFEDDRHLALSRYRYDLFARLDSRNLLDTDEANLLRKVFYAVKADGKYPALLVFDLQYVIDQANGRTVRETVQ
jgi:hypothetical protein